MRRALAGLVLLLCACAPGATAAPPAPADLVFVSGAAGLRIYQARDGALLAQLPDGAFDATLTTGGDLGEAYLVNAGGVFRVRATRPVRVDRLADAAGQPPFAAALVPAPGLGSFAGARTVLVVLSNDGRLSGYQAGTRIWSRSVAVGAGLRRVGEVATVREGSSWQRVAAETGELTALPSCPGGPVGGTPERLVLACELVPPPPAGGGFDLQPATGDEVVAWPDGTFYRLHAGIPRPGQRGRGGGRPALSAGGDRLHWPAEYPGATAAASSRDGNYVYTVGGGRLRVYAAGDGRQVASYAAEGSDIPLVAGG